MSHSPSSCLQSTVIGRYSLSTVRLPSGSIISINGILSVYRKRIVHIIIGNECFCLPIYSLRFPGWIQDSLLNRVFIEVFDHYCDFYRRISIIFAFDDVNNDLVPPHVSDLSSLNWVGGIFHWISRLSLRYPSRSLLPGVHDTVTSFHPCYPLRSSLISSSVFPANTSLTTIDN